VGGTCRDVTPKPVWGGGKHLRYHRWGGGKKARDVEVSKWYPNGVLSPAKGPEKMEGGLDSIGKRVYEDLGVGKSSELITLSFGQRETGENPRIFRRKPTNSCPVC